MTRKTGLRSICVLLGVCSLRAGPLDARPGSPSSSPASPSGVKSAGGAAAELRLIPGREIIRELEDLGRFEPVAGFYAGRMGRTYDAAMAVVSRRAHYLK